MAKGLAPDSMYELPSGLEVHPWRLIHKDGTLMWKHALLHHNHLVALPENMAHESHIIKTAQRIEELNSWVSKDREPWDCLMPHCWYNPEYDELSEGICLYMKHVSLPNSHVLEILKPHVLDHETLEEREVFLFFKRC